MNEFTGTAELKDSIALVPEVLPAIDCKKVVAVGRPNPLKSEVIYAEFPEGISIAQILDGVNPDYIGVALNGHEIPYIFWKHCRPKAGTQLQVIAKLHGNSQTNKAILSVVAMIAITALSIYVGGAGIAFLGIAAKSFGAYAMAAAINVVGNMAVRALIGAGGGPPVFQSNQGTNPNERFTALTGTGNRDNPFGVIPQVIGEMVLFPPLAAKPFTHVHGTVSQIYCLFDLGFGFIDVDQLKIGGQEIAGLTNVDFEVGTEPSFFSQTAIEDQLNIDLTAVGANALRTTDLDTDFISVDFSCPNGFYATDDQNQNLIGHKNVTIQYRQVGAIDWINVGGFGLAQTDEFIQIVIPPGLPESAVFRLDSHGREPIYFSVGWRVPVSGQYEVQVGPVEAAIFDALPNTNSVPLKVEDFFWGILRSVKYSNPSTVESPYGDLPTRIGMQVRASQEMQGSLQQFSCRARLKVKTWDVNLNQWAAPAYSKNPAWLLWWLLTASEMNSRRVAENRLNLFDFILWAIDCDAKGYVFSAVYDSVTTIDQVARDIAAAGRATFSVKDNLYTIVRDVPQSVPAQHFTPRNTWEFEGQRVFTDEVHGLRVNFMNPAAGYQQDEIIVYDDGYNADGSGGKVAATRFETLDMRGIVDPVAAWKLGRYHLAASRLRPNDYSFSCDVENLACQRGDLVKQTHDVMRWGSAWGRISAIVLCGQNVFADASDFSAWSPFNGMQLISANNPAPDGTNTATLFQPSGALGSQGVTRTVTPSSDGSGYTLTIWMNGTTNGQSTAFGIRDDTVGAFIVATADSDGADNGTGLRRINPTSGVWKKYRISVPATPVGHKINLYFYPGDTGVNPVNSLYVWNAVAWTGLPDRVQSIALDEVIDLQVNQQWSVRIRNNLGGSLVSPLAGYAPGQYVWDLVNPLIGVNLGDLVQLGNPGLEAVDLIVKKIEPGPDLSAKITCLDYAPAIYNADDTSINPMPPFVSAITKTAYEEPPPVPTIIAITSSPNAGPEDSDGAHGPGIRGTLGGPATQVP